MSGDGCSSNCFNEVGYQCEPIYPNLLPPGQDICYCDAYLDKAEWTNFWGRIEITFYSQIYFYSSIAQ